MTRRIKRIAATITAGVLLVCVSFASFAEEAEEILDGNTEAAAVEIVEEMNSVAEGETEAEQATEAEAETAEAPTETVEPAAAVEPAAEEAAQGEESTEAQAAPEETETVAEEAADSEEEYYEFTDEDDIEYEDLSEDAGYIDQAVVQQHIPEVTEELITASEQYTAEETESPAEAAAEEKTETIAVKAWIVSENEEIFVGDVLKLQAKGQPELNGDVTWEIRSELWDKDVWKQIETGRTLELEVTESNAEDLVRFTTAEGVVSEEFRINAKEQVTEETTDAETPAETETEEENRPESGNEEPVIAEETENQSEASETAEPAEEPAGTGAEETADAAADENEEESEAAPEEQADETAEAAVTRAWIAATENEDGSITLNACADPELTGISTWQTWDEENGKWQKIGYGDQVTVEAADGSQYRFVMQDGTESETWETVSPAEEETETEDEVVSEVTEETEEANPEEAEEAGENEEEFSEEIPEETPAEEEAAPVLPEDRSVKVSMTWDDENPGIGSVAHFSAELKGYEGFAYRLQWLESSDNINWTEVEGATEAQMDVVVTAENYNHFWRIEVRVLDPGDEAL